MHIQINYLIIILVAIQLQVSSVAIGMVIAQQQVTMSVIYSPSNSELLAVLTACSCLTDSQLMIRHCGQTHHCQTVATRARSLHFSGGMHDVCS